MLVRKRETYLWVQTFENDLTKFSSFQAQGAEGRRERREGEGGGGGREETHSRHAYQVCIQRPWSL